VHAVLFLILCFVNSAGLFMLAGAEFLAMILIVVYVGAVAVLFLFVTMMIDVDYARCARACSSMRRWDLWSDVMLLLELLLVAGTFVLPTPEAASAEVFPINEAMSNTRQLGLLLYTATFSCSRALAAFCWSR
jgi:NADH-quinone oxidoreductase subunit J